MSVTASRVAICKPGPALSPALNGRGGAQADTVAPVDKGAAVVIPDLSLGLDTAGERRFLSSRKRANGPTLADRRGKSVLDGTGLHA